MVGVTAFVVPRLSRLIIDVDKDWAGKRIVNLGAPQGANDAARKADVDSVNSRVEKFKANLKWQVYTATSDVNFAGDWTLLLYGDVTFNVKSIVIPFISAIVLPPYTDNYGVALQIERANYGVVARAGLSQMLRGYEYYLSGAGLDTVDPGTYRYSLYGRAFYPDTVTLRAGSQFGLIIIPIDF